MVYLFRDYTIPGTQVFTPCHPANLAFVGTGGGIQHCPFSFSPGCLFHFHFSAVNLLSSRVEALSPFDTSSKHRLGRTKNLSNKCQSLCFFNQPGTRGKYTLTVDPGPSLAICKVAFPHLEWFWVNWALDTEALEGWAPGTFTGWTVRPNCLGSNCAGPKLPRAQ